MRFSILGAWANREIRSEKTFLTLAPYHDASSWAHYQLLLRPGQELRQQYLYHGRGVRLQARGCIG